MDLARSAGVRGPGGQRGARHRLPRPPPPGADSGGRARRPSDAIALALRLHGPILVAEELFARAAAGRASPAAHLWGLTVQDLTPEMAVLFQAPGGRGVLVSDVA